METTMSILLSPQKIILFLLIFLCSRLTSTESKCTEAERQALLKVKQDLHQEFIMMDGADLLSSWGSEEAKKECCQWIGIRCANKSGHIITLDLSPSTFGSSDYLWALRGKISPSIFELTHLNYLDLSFINFTGNDIPSSIATLTKLKHLNLSFTFVSGEIPSQISNLSNLQYLDLSYNFGLSAKNLGGLSRLFLLRELSLSHSNLSKAKDWLQVVNSFPHLTNLQLAVCDLPDIVSPSLSLVNSSKNLVFLDLCCNKFSSSVYQWLFNFSNSLQYLELSLNQIKSSIPEAFRNMTSLAYLDLSHNQLEGFIPEAVGKYMIALEYLDLSNNTLQGEIPKSIWNLPKLYAINVELNNLSGQLPESIGQLSQLESLGILGNSLEGVISEAHFSKLSKLNYLTLSSNSFVLNISLDWIPPFRLDVVLLRSCKMGPLFPKWLQTQKNYSRLDISNAGISDTIPNWFWELSAELLYMNVSNNNLSGTVANSSIEFAYANEIDLRSNQLEGPIPLFLLKVSALHLYQNKFSELYSICDITEDVILNFLDVSYNQFSGELPDCWSHFKELRVLTMGNNKLSGKIPVSLGSLTLINTLSFANNSFVGEIPTSLKNCKELIVFDVSQNKLSGPLPTWIGGDLPYLVILSLRSNHFNGSIPSNLCDLPSLQVLDLSLNSFSENVPKCLNLLSAMKSSWSSDTTISHKYTSYPLSPRTVYYRIYDDRVLLLWKGRLSQFINNLRLVKSIDLSSNKLTGEIPREISELIGLISLNLSRNNLSGQMPSKIGQLTWLETLDLSNNHISGRIPSSLSEVARLNTLDLSNNNLSGKIPIGTQLQSFDAAVYAGNLELCGDPLPKTCPSDQEAIVPGIVEAASKQEDDQEGFVTQGFYVSMAVGFATAFWAFCGALVFNKSWRNAYFNFLNDVCDWFYVKAAVYKAKVLRIIKS